MTFFLFLLEVIKLYVIIKIKQETLNIKQNILLRLSHRL